MDFKAGIYDASGYGIAGSSALWLILKRDSDDYFYDWNDSTFKVSGWTAPSGQYTEVNASIVPGEYEVTVNTSAWSDGVYSCYTKYMGSPPWVDVNEVRVYDGVESSALVEELGTQAKNDVNSEADTALSDYDGPTKSEMDTAHALLATASGLVTHDTEIKALEPLGTPMRGTDNAYTDTPPTTSEIATALLASTIDGTLDMETVLKMLLARIPGNQIAVSDNTYTFYDQSGAVLFTVTYTPTSTTTTIP